MKPTSFSSVPMAILLGLLSLLAAGCAHTICIKAIDASTKEPLAGVSTQWLQYYHGYFHLGHEGPTNLPFSGKDGLISVGDLHRNWSSSFIFACPGYSNIYGEYTSRGRMIQPVDSEARRFARMYCDALLRAPDVCFWLKADIVDTTMRFFALNARLGGSRKK